VSTVLEELRQESADGTVKTSALSPGYVQTEFGNSVTGPEVRAQVCQGMETFALDPDSVARAVEFAVDQPWEVEIGELSIRPTVHGNDLRSGPGTPRRRWRHR
jgi:NADP-dependent 3-hydroxy acid dehydrogenase YdfG